MCGAVRGRGAATACMGLVGSETTDEGMGREIEGLIREHRYTAEYAVSHFIRRYAKVLEGLSSPTFAARAADLFDIEKRPGGGRCTLDQGG